jgi:hypothetical protein
VVAVLRNVLWREVQLSTGVPTNKLVGDEPGGCG